MSVLDAILGIQTYVTENPSSSISEAQRVLDGGLASATGLAYDTAVRLISRFPNLSHPFPTSRPAALRELLMRITLVAEPAWARLAPKGFRYVTAYMPPNAEQCFANAGLTGNDLTDEAIRWWDSLANHFRSAADAARLVVGRRGERLTMKHEALRLMREGRSDLQPSWMALEDNSLGYDILSHRLEGGQARRLFIEVKACVDLPLRFYLSRAEWIAAQQLAPDYLIHLWNLADESLLELTLDDVDDHTPTDHGCGKWHRLEVTLL